MPAVQPHARFTTFVRTAWALAALALLLAVTPAARAAAPPAGAATDRAAAVRAALTALKAQSGDDALTVFALPRAVRAGTKVTQAGPEATAAAARRVRAPKLSPSLNRAGVTAMATRTVLKTTEPSWLLYADQGPSQAYEHPGRIVVVGARTGTVRVSPVLRWVPLFDGRLPEFFRSPAAYRSKDLRVLDRPWKQKSLPAPAGARATASAAEAAAAQKRLADAIARDKSCALRVSDTLGDFYDFGSVDRTRAALGQAFNRLARLNPGFVTRRYTARAGVTAVDAAQKLIAGGCTDLALYVAGSGTRTGTPGIVIGVRPRGRAIQWHMLTAAAIEGLVQANRDVTFKLIFDAPYAGRVAQQLSDEKNVSVLLTAGTADEPSFTYLPQILGGQGVIQNTGNPMGLLEFTNNLIVGIDRFANSPQEIDHAIAERAAGRSDTLLGWLFARALDLAPSLFTTQVLGTQAQQRIPVVTRPVLNHAPVAATPPLTTREDVAADLTLVATDADLDPLTYTVQAAPAHGTLSGTPPLLRYTPDPDFDGTDGLTFRASDGHGGVAEQRVSITVTSDNDAPAVIGGASGTPATYTEQQSSPAAVTVDDGLTVTDPDSPQLKSATVAIVSGHVAGDVLATTAPGALTQSYDAQAGVLTLTGHVGRAVFESALRAVTFRSTSDDPGTARTIRFSVDDGDGDQAGVPADRPVVVVPVNDAPALSLPAGTVALTEDTPATFAAGTPDAISVADPDAGAAGLEVTVAASAGTLAVGATQPGLAVTGAGTGTLKLTGPVAAVNDALDGLAYTPAPDANGPATLTVTADDHGHTGTGGAKTDAGTVNLAIAAVNDKPVNTVPGGQQVAENGTLTFGPSNALSVADADAGGADVRVTLTATHGALTLGATAGLTFTTGDGTSDATMTFDGAISAVNTALAGTTYAPDTNYTGAASVQLSTNDLGHSGGAAETDTDTIAVQVLGTNRAPVNQLPSAQSTDEDTDLILSVADGNALTVTDPDAGSADVQVALSVTTGVLHLAQTTGLTVTAGADGTAAVTVRGALTDLNAALDGLRFTPAADYAGAATLGVATDDLGHTGLGGALTDTDNLAITVAAVNDAPALTAPAAATVAEEGTATFSVANVNPISVADVDAGAGTIAVDLAATHGTVSLGSTAGVTVTGNGTAAVSVSGTRGAVNTALEGTTFTGAANYAGAAQLQVDVSDQGHTGSGGAKTDTKTIAITVTAVNDAPAISAPAAATVNKDGSRTFSAGNGNAVTIADVDAGSGAVRVQLAVAHGTLRLAATTGLTFTTGDGTDDAAMDFTGTLADVAAALDGLRYAPDAGYSGADALDVDVDDQGNTGSGGAQTDSASVTLNVVDLNTAPVNTVPGAQTTDEDTTLTFAGATKLAVSDADVAPSTGVLEVTLDADHGTFTLDGTTGLSFTTGDGTADAHIVAQGSPDALNAALDGATYTPDANYNGSDTITLETDDLGATGAPGPLTDTDTVAVTITAVNDAPALVQPDGGVLTYTEDSPTEDHADAIAPNLAVSDADDANVAGATVTLATAASGDALVFTNQNGITGSYNSGTGVLTLSGSATKADYQTALRSVQYRTTSEDPDQTRRTVTFRVDDGHAANHLSNQVTRQIDVVAVNDAPVASNDTFNNAARAVGNTSLVVDGPGSGTPDPAGPQKTVSGDILANDSDADSATSAFTVTPLSDVATTNGGRVTLEADGDFTYLPPQGCANSTDSFDYTLNDNDATAPQSDAGTVTISIADCVWYVDAGAGAQPTATGGTSQNPYNSLADLDGAGGAGDEDGANDKVFLYAGSYAGPFPLESGQQVLTKRHGLTVSDGGSGTVTLEAPAAGASTITNGVTASTNNTLEGVDFGSSATTALSGTSVGTLTVNKTTSGGIVNPAGGGVDIGGTGNALDVHLTTLSTTGGSTGLTLANASGTFEATGGAIANASGPDVSLSGGSADVTLGGTVSDTAGTFVSVANQTGGTKDFNGKLTSTGSGVALTSNSGATLRFDGGLALTTATANAFSATGGGTVAVTDPASDSNVLNTTTGTPLTVTSTNIHSDDLTFESISSNGAADGVVLNTTGSAGGLNVTGNGGTCTAGTPTCTGGTIQASTGPGVRADSVGGGVALTRVRVLNGTDDGIRFANSDGLSVDNSLVTGNGNSVDAAAVPAGGRDRGIDVENGTGNVAVTSTQVSTSYYDNIRLDDDSGSVDFDLTSSTIAGAKNGDGVQLYGDGTTSMKADVIGSTFTTNFDDGFQLVTPGGSVTPTLNLNFNTNQVSADASQVSAGALVTISPGANATTKVAMSGNTLNTAKGSDLILNPAATSSFDATVTSNTIQNAGGIGIWGKPAQQAQSRMKIANNTLSNYQGQGMYLRHGEGIGGVANYVVQGNTLNSGVGQEGIFVEAGTTSSGSESVSVCADIGGAGALANNLANAGGAGFDDVAFSRYTNSNLTLPGYSGGSDPTAYVQSRNTGSPVVSNWGPQDPTGGAACQNPALPPAP